MFLFKFGVTYATEDYVTSGKRISSKVFIYTLNSSL